MFQNRVLQSLKLHNQLFWFMYPSCIQWKSSKCCFIFERNLWKVSLWYFAMIGMSSLLICPALLSLISHLGISATEQNVSRKDQFQILDSCGAVVGFTCLYLNYILWKHKREIVQTFNQLIHMVRILPYRFPLASYANPRVSKNKRIISFVETSTFLLSSLNPGLALVTVTLDQDPLFRMGNKYYETMFGTSFLTSLIFANIRFIFQCVLISEITRTISFITTVFTTCFHQMNYLMEAYGYFVGNYSASMFKIIFTENTLIYSRIKMIFRHFNTMLQVWSVTFLVIIFTARCSIRFNKYERYFQNTEHNNSVDLTLCVVSLVPLIIVLYGMILYIFISEKFESMKRDLVFRNNSNKDKYNVITRYQKNPVHLTSSDFKSRLLLHKCSYTFTVNLTLTFSYITQGVKR